MQENILKLKKILTNTKQIVITTHRGPDGDAMGSSLAIMHLLKDLGHYVNLITPNSYPDFLHWMPGNDKVIIFEEENIKAQKLTSNADIIFFMDFSNIDRIADYSKLVSNSAATKVLIDHHENPDTSIADIIFSDIKASSTAQLLYEILEKMDFQHYINKNIAECLYAGIMTDTGSFKYSSTTAKTHHIIAKLIAAGADNPKIHDLVYDNLSASRMKLLGYCLNEKLLIYTEHNSAIISLTEDELIKFNFKKGDTEGIVNYALAIKEIKFAAFIVEKDGVVKLSLRSKGRFKVNEIASKYFKGGGHANAAGGISETSVNETITRIEKIITEYKIN